MYEEAKSPHFCCVDSSRGFLFSSRREGAGFTGGRAGLVGSSPRGVWRFAVPRHRISDVSSRRTGNPQRANDGGFLVVFAIGCAPRIREGSAIRRLGGDCGLRF